MNQKMNFKKAARILRVISHPVRLKIIMLLAEGKMNVTEVQKATHCKQSATSQHLNQMASENVLKRTRRGNEVYYAIKHKDILDILSCIKKCSS